MRMNEKKGGKNEEILNLLNNIDNKNIIIIDLLLEIYRLRTLLKKHNIDYRRSYKRKT